jgi:CheY-like chemotaxis protein
VADSGVGIAEDRQSSVFQEFVQADASVSRRFGGSGLGLSITRRLVGLMGGEIALVSKEGVGTRVTVTLPLEEVHQPLGRSSDQRGTEMEPSQTALSRDDPRCVLLVEDIDINQELLTGMLGRMGYRVEVASNGAEAIRMATNLTSDPTRYNLIFMDVQMPVLDGLSATRAIRALGGPAAQVPIIALTANAFASEIEECRDAGMDDHLSKPVSMAALGATLTKWLSTTPGEDTGPRHADAPQLTVAAKFASRARAYAERLDEIRAALPQASYETRKALLIEARKMAHNLAGTAGMCGHAPLGDLAAEVSSRIEEWAHSDDGTVESRVTDLAAALRRAA